MLRLEDLIGKKVLLLIANSQSSGYEAILHGVENGGIWIESNAMEKLIGHSRKKSTHARQSTKPVFFIPYAQIVSLVSDSTELDGKILGE